MQIRHLATRCIHLNRSTDLLASSPLKQATKLPFLQYGLTKNQGGPRSHYWRQTAREHSGVRSSSRSRSEDFECDGGFTSGAFVHDGDNDGQKRKEKKIARNSLRETPIRQREIRATTDHLHIIARLQRGPHQLAQIHHIEGLLRSGAPEGRAVVRGSRWG